ncbi:MAG: peroxiredoxin [Verrucomicrobiota bacterium]|nr:peroxiredoxin [Verrucomicrobiota bacterium]
MRNFLRTVLAVALCMAAANLSAEPLKVGDTAPDFSLQGSDGKTYKLSDFKGKAAVVIAWFPKAFTGGCTAECKSMKEHGKALRHYKAAYFTASTDDAETNRKFAESLALDYPILSDPTKETAKAFGILNDKGMADRVTFYIDKQGKIAAVDTSVKTSEHGKDIADKLDALKVPHNH